MYDVFQFSAYGYDGHAKTLPRLLHTPQSFQLEFILDNVTSNYSDTRFVLEIALLTSDDSGNFQLKHYHSIDDEYTPGVFTVRNSAKYASNSYFFCNLPFIYYISLYRL